MNQAVISRHGKSLSCSWATCGRCMAKADRHMALCLGRMATVHESLASNVLYYWHIRSLLGFDASVALLTRCLSGACEGQVAGKGRERAHDACSRRRHPLRPHIRPLPTSSRHTSARRCAHLMTSNAPGPRPGQLSSLCQTRMQCLSHTFHSLTRSEI